MAQTVKCLPTVWETRVQSLGREDPLEKAMATHSSTLAWKIPWAEEPVSLQSIGSQRVGHDSVTKLSLLLLSSLENVCVCVCVLVVQSYPTLCDLWTVAHQAPLSMEFSRQEYWTGWPFPSPGDLPDSGVKPRSPALQADSLPSQSPGKPWKMLFF